MKRKLFIFLSILSLFLISVSVAGTIHIYANEDGNNTTETTEPETTGEEPIEETVEEEPVDEDDAAEEPKEEPKQEAAPTVREQVNEFLNKWLTPIVSALSGIAGIILAVVILFSRIKKIVEKIIKGHEVNQEEIDQLKADYESVKQQAKEQYEANKKLAIEMKDDVLKLQAVVKANEKTKEDLMKCIGVMMTSIPQFVASGKAEEMMKIIGNLNQKADEAVNELVDENVEEKAENEVE